MTSLEQRVDELEKCRCVNESMPEQSGVVYEGLGTFEVADCLLTFPSLAC